MMRWMLTALLLGAAASAAPAQDPAPTKLDTPPTAEEIAAARTIGAAFFKNGQYHKALEQWELVLRGVKNDAPAWFAKARCYQQLLEFDLSALACDRALQSRPGWEDAKRLRDSMRATAQQVRLDRQLGENLFKEGKFKAALVHWRRLLKALPADAVGWFYTAACHAKLRRLGDAIAACDEAIALRPGWVQAISLRAQMKLFAADYTGARKDFAAAISAERKAGHAPHPTFLQLEDQCAVLAAAAKRIQVGKPAPLPRLHDVHRKSIAFADLFPEKTGPKAIVFIFHGGHASPVALGELARLREHIKRLESTGARVYCISRDTPLENKILASEKGLKFPLLSDSGGTTTKAYGMVDLRQAGRAAGTLLGVAIVDAKRVLRYRQVVVDPRGQLDFKALAVLAGKITGTAPPPDKDDTTDDTGGDKKRD